MHRRDREEHRKTNNVWMAKRSVTSFEKDNFSVSETGGSEEKIQVFRIGVEPIGTFMVVRSCWVIRTGWRESQKFAWEFKVN